MRLTKDMRDAIVAKALANLPRVDHWPAVREVIQNTIVEHMEPEVRAVWDNPDLRGCLSRTEFSIRRGNRTLVNFYGPSGLLGLRTSDRNSRGDVTIYMDDAVGARVENNVIGAITEALHSSGLVAAQERNRDLLESVRNRLRHAVSSVSTIKRLYDVLEPELHHLIPRVEGVNLPVVAVNVVDDLKALGAELPDVPKALEV